MGFPIALWKPSAPLHFGLALVGDERKSMRTGQCGAIGQLLLIANSSFLIGKKNTGGGEPMPVSFTQKSLKSSRRNAYEQKKGASRLARTDG